MRPRPRALLLIVFAAVAAGITLWPSSAQSLIASHQCSFCHNLHNAAGDQLTNEASTEVLCLTCHGPTGISSLKADVHSNRTPKTSYPPFRVSCRGCHNAHDNGANWTSGTNIELVGAVTSTRGFAGIVTMNSGTRDVVFESRGSSAGGPTRHSFADSDEDRNGYYDGVCETCHTLTSHHTNFSPDTRHHTGDTCPDCHAHADRFMP